MYEIVEFKIFAIIYKVYMIHIHGDNKNIMCALNIKIYIFNIKKYKLRKEGAYGRIRRANDQFSVYQSRLDFFESGDFLNCKLMHCTNRYSDFLLLHFNGIYFYIMLYKCIFIFLKFLL
jgi:hypothetical protein